MKLHEKMRIIRKEKGLTMLELQEKLKGIFGEKALEYNSLARIEQGNTTPRMNSLIQICVGLGITLHELREGVEEESTYVDQVKKNERIDRVTYGPHAYSEILTPPKRSFLCAELVLEPQGKTTTEQDPLDMVKFEKWVYCLKGRLTCYVGQEEHTLRKGDCLSFISTLPHYFENKTTKRVSCLIVQNPRPA